MSSNLSLASRLVLAGSLLAAVALACASPSGDPAADELARSIASTATAAAQQTISPQEELGTAQALATITAHAIQGTEAALSGLSAEAVAATATAIAPMLDELPAYGIDPAQGKPGWVHPPVDLEVSGYMQTASANDFGSTVVGDFVLASDITLDTQYGTSGCGYVLRSNGDQEEPSQYMLILSRVTSGRAEFMTFADGQPAGMRDLYPLTFDPAFNAAQGGKNRIVVVAIGPAFTLYSNGSKLGEIRVDQPPTSPDLPPPPSTPIDSADPAAAAEYAKQMQAYGQQVGEIRATFQPTMGGLQPGETNFERGFVAMVALSESGVTHCRFENTWLYLLGE
jgi:hypothetical protein